MAFELGFKPLIKYKDTRAAIDAQVPFPAGYYNQLMFSSDINEIRSVLNDGTLSSNILSDLNRQEFDNFTGTVLTITAGTLPISKPKNILVYDNGMLQDASFYTLTSATVITLTTAAVTDSITVLWKE